MRIPCCAANFADLYGNGGAAHFQGWYSGDNDVKMAKGKFTGTTKVNGFSLTETANSKEISD